jgi:hypothetical protein
MIVAQVSVVMLVIRLVLLFGGALLGALRVGISCNEADSRSRCNQDANRSHGLSLAGRQHELRSGVVFITRTNVQRDSLHRVDVSTNYVIREVRFVTSVRVAC